MEVVFPDQGVNNTLMPAKKIRQAWTLPFRVGYRKFRQQQIFC